MAKKIRVGLIFGGRSGEHEVSIASAMSVYNALDKSRYDVTFIGINKDGRWLLPDPKPLLAQAANPMAIRFDAQAESYPLIPPTDGKFDVILPILHGTFGEDGTIQGMLEMAQIPYAGAGVLGSAIG
ncbi:MAG TPA: D-alanine--D-alanine ligase A, partial [Bdellovibrionales bacterium]|nr:D-alanine--D-alanine ligase A [Bdellovibrionales bacterium]